MQSRRTSILIFVISTLMVFPFSDIKAISGQIYVTKILKKDGFVTVTLNNAIEIQNIHIVKNNGKTILRFPYYKSGKGKITPQVKVPSQNLYKRILKAIITGQTRDEQSEDLEFTIGNLRFMRHIKRRANVEVTFNNSLSVTLGILQSEFEGENAYWIGYPGQPNKITGSYQETVVITNSQLKETVENAVLYKFERLLSEISQK